MTDPECVIKQEVKEEHDNLVDSRWNDVSDKIAPSSSIKEANSSEELILPHANFSSMVVNVKSEYHSDSSESQTFPLKEEKFHNAETAPKRPAKIKKFEKSSDVTNSLEKRFKCDQCSYSSNWNQCLKNHKLLHSRVNSFKCDLCTYESHLKERLDKHKLIHSRKQTFKCDQCSYTTRRKDTLKFHTMNHFPEKTFKCDECPYSSCWKQALNVHKLNHLSNKEYYKCDQCFYTCSTKGRLNHHNLIHLSSAVNEVNNKISESKATYSRKK